MVVDETDRNEGSDLKERTETIFVELGWPGTLDVREITSARYFEALVPLWVRVGTVLDI